MLNRKKVVIAPSTTSVAVDISAENENALVAEATTPSAVATASNDFMPL